MDKLTLEERRRRRFSESFRKQQVSYIEEGSKTIGQVAHEFDVKADSVRLWVKKYGSKELPPPILVQTEEDVNRIKSLEKEAAHLKQLIGSQHVELVYLKELVKLAKEKLGEDFEKKSNSGPDATKDRKCQSGHHNGASLQICRNNQAGLS
ncbi:MAG: transposase [Saprospiraceae bacterium]|nr:transposase [Saprospiraceae bacterium]